MTLFSSQIPPILSVPIHPLETFAHLEPSVLSNLLPLLPVHQAITAVGQDFLKSLDHVLLDTIVVKVPHYLIQLGNHLEIYAPRALIVKKEVQLHCSVLQVHSHLTLEIRIVQLALLVLLEAIAPHIDYLLPLIFVQVECIVLKDRLLQWEFLVP